MSARFPTPAADLIPLRDETTRDFLPELLSMASEGARLALGIFHLREGLLRVYPEGSGQFGFGSEVLEQTPAAWLERIHPEDRSPLQWALDSLAAGLPQAKGECRLLGGDERWREISWSGRLERDEQGRPARISFCARDISEEVDTREKLRQLARRAEAEREADRSGLARQLHDELGQWLTAIRMDADRLLTLARRGESLPANGELEERLATIRELAGDSISAVQHLCSEYRASAVTDVGIASAVRSAASVFEARTGIRCEVDGPVEEPPLNRKQCRELYYALHEALTNIIRHAHASRVQLKLRTAFNNFELEVSDNGRGLPAGALSAPSSIGLFGLQERLHGLGGLARISSQPGGGCRVKLTVPLPATAQ